MTLSEGKRWPDSTSGWISQQVQIILTCWSSLLRGSVLNSGSMAKDRLKTSRDLNDRYFQRHFARLVGEHGGKWVVLVGGELIGVGKRKEVARLIQKARTMYPDSTPFASPIPTREELECVL